MPRQYFRINFPDHEWRQMFTAFNCGKGRLTEKRRRRNIKKLATKEGLDPIRTDQQWTSALPSITRLYSETGDNQETFVQLLESLRSRSGKFRADADCLVQLVLSFLGLLQDTSDVERAFATLELLELKRRVRLLPEVAIKDAIQIALEVPSQIGALVLKSPIPYSTPGGEKVQIVWRPRSFITKAQGKYVSFWGSLRLQSRSLAPVSLKTRAAQLKKPWPRILWKKKTYSGSQPGKLTKRGLRCKWDATVKGLVKRMREKKESWCWFRWS